MFISAVSENIGVLIKSVRSVGYCIPVNRLYHYMAEGIDFKRLRSAVFPASCLMSCPMVYFLRESTVGYRFSESIFRCGRTDKGAAEYMKITLEDCILEHIKRYPEMEIQDVVKIVFQSEFGGGHMIKDPSDSLNRLYRNMKISKKLRGGLPVYFELIGNRLGRLYLDGIDAHLSLETVNRFFVNTAARVNSDRESFEKKLDRLRKMAKEGRLPWTAQALEDYLEDYKAKGYHAVSHSQTYRRRYHPSYRVISEDYMTYLKVFEWLDRHLNRTDGRCIIAIDGKCGSGKKLSCPADFRRLPVQCDPHG